MKLKRIAAPKTNNDKVTCVIEFVPMVKRNVGIGFITENEATLEDFKKYPVVERDWLDINVFER